MQSRGYFILPIPSTPFVFSLIFQNPTLFRHTSILTNYFLLVTLKAKYQNDPNKVKKCHMFQVIEIFQARGISKYFLTGLKEHTVFMGGRTDDVDKAILEVRTALVEFTQNQKPEVEADRDIDLGQYCQKPRETGSSLQRLERHVGGGNRTARGGLSSSQ